ncbi:uncharacterized protein LOC113333808 [Papaver somniferum]|uniref:uncharacterized protein LOC113333808 n=1 Tax=Papaver somniferum TaxID=3469 RepID=UPI000E703B90|nr:uncharacterized protein LOC113333808 [Papaver somniferum]
MSPAYIQGGCIANIGSCNTWFDSVSGLVRTKKLRTKGSELANRKREKNKAMPTDTSFLCSSIDETLSLSSRARCKKELILFSLASYDMMGQSFASLAPAVAATESAIGLAIFVITFRVRGTIAVEFINSIQG